MSEPLPTFPYHPDPIATGAVKRSERSCQACGRQRGYIYTGPVYSKDELDDSLCPWCIADGGAAARFDATFSDNHHLVKDRVPAPIVEEVTHRAPGYESWQGEAWLSHCGDACEFWGDLPRGRLAQMDPDGRGQLSRQHRLTESDWLELSETYSPGNDPAIYVFKCRKCGKECYHMDCS